MDERYKAKVREFTQLVLSDVSSQAASKAGQFISKALTSHVDGKATLNFDDFLLHLAAQRRVLANITISHEHLVASGCQVASVHIVTAEKHDGTQIRARVIMVCRFDEEGKIEACDEVHEWLQGQSEDHDLGHRVAAAE